MIKNYIFLAILFNVLTSCHPDKYYSFFTIKNNSASGICYSYSNSYPDTSIPNNKYLPTPIIAPSNVIQSGESYTVVKAATLGDYFKSVPSGTMEIFIFDAQVVQTIPWDTVVTKYMVLKRYDLSLDSIKKMNGVINYP